MKDRCCDSLKWGDEIEYMICKVKEGKIELMVEPNKRKILKAILGNHS